MTNELSLLGPFCAFGSSVTWAIGSAAYSRMSEKYSPFAVNFARGFIALPLFILAAFFVSGSWPAFLSDFQMVRASHWGWFTLSMTASYGLGDTLFIWSSRSLGVPGALAIASCYPLWTVLAGYFFSNESLSVSQGMGLVATLVGIIVVILNGPKKKASIPLSGDHLNNTQVDDKQESSSTISIAGVLLAFAASIAWATNSFSVSRGGADLSPAVGNTIRMIMALILSTCFGRIFAPQSSILLPAKQVYQSLWIFVIEAFVGSYLYMYGLSRSPLALGSTLASLAPVISVPVAVLLGLEKFSIQRTLGVATVVVGITFLLGVI